MKQQKETVGACSVLALGRQNSMPHTNYSSSEDIQRKFFPLYNTENMNYSASIIEPFMENYYFYPNLFPQMSLSPDTSSPGPCELDFTDNFSPASTPPGFTTNPLSIKMEPSHQGSLPSDHDYNVAMTLAKDMPMSHLPPYPTQGNYRLNLNAKLFPFQINC